jgi:hypothetical protein
VNAFDEYIALVFAYRLDNPAQRNGQAHFNALHAVHPGIAETIRSDFRVDPFHDDDRLPAFLAYVGTRLGVTA